MSKQQTELSREPLYVNIKATYSDDGGLHNVSGLRVTDNCRLNVPCRTREVVDWVLQKMSNARVGGMDPFR